jgi:spore maturation protein CgeB
MRIIVIGAKPSADSMEKHVIETLSTMGHTVAGLNDKDIFEFNPTVNRWATHVARSLLREPERLLERKLVRQVSEFCPDLIIVLLGSGISPKTIDRIRTISRSPIVCWCQDAITTMGRQYLIGSQYDKAFVKDLYLADRLASFAGMDVTYMPEACNPVYHRSVGLSNEDKELFDADVSTFGNLYYYRQAILQMLLPYRLKIWGYRPDWLVDRLGSAFMGRPVYELEKCKAVAASRIVLNTMHFGEIAGINCRMFEVAGCGGFQLATHSTAIAAHFEVGIEVETFRTSAEMLEKVDYFLRHPDHATRIALAGQLRAHSEHTYTKRLEQILKASCG